MSQQDRQPIHEKIKFPKESIYANGIDIEWFDGSLDSTIQALQELGDYCQWELGYSDISISSSHHWDDVYIDVWGKRWETDEEYKARKANIRAERKAKRDAKKKLIEQESTEYAEYIRLKALFES